MEGGRGERASVSAGPLTRLLSHCTHLAHLSQSFQQRHRLGGGQARRGAESDANHQPQVRCDLEPAKCLLSCQRPLTRPYSLTVSILPLACSLRGNGIRDKGVTALAAILKETKITDLKCAATPECSLLCQRPLTLPSPQLGSLDSNQLCGVNFSGKGTYTTESITKLCEGLKGSSVTSLRCTIGLSVCLSVNAH